MQTMSLTSTFCGCSTAFRASSGRQSQNRLPCLVKAEAADTQGSRRGVLFGLAGASLLLSKPQSSQAAFGESASIFKSKPTNTTGFIPYSGEGFALLLPSKWNPSKEREESGVALRYEDNGDNLNHVTVITRKSDKSSIDQYGAPDEFLNSIKNLLGEQTFKGETISEGGFAKNKVSTAALLDVQKAKDSKGKTYYKYDILSRSADGNEGGKHNLITAAVGNGTLYICQVTIGDKRWFKGANKDGQGVSNSFVVA
ncbi:oxygen evolving enhancer 2 of photosystem II [Coccomyxa subellipsoidea C-169]|uniref:Oxygen evolving enhancer 2 of photosystem II n=1 Tax=Coccomyxa subellipsoidea (strain C-169) TaxID=574566 RepID=I0Z2Y7_COCSC|nr:oxygen evolving enhancer 2 of photosystem II [Coccomyxa subellipsoidea C-169]EIE25006.1 oxygen evolving enhancer 2 of photosystem II [Coccomyxa subellipsoidea C-169]|eukprot:XP_005649550.1 oxygen evolving enhancer 2 of photosystem II [Coccomyxa subellipsoidea C-169]